MWAIVTTEDVTDRKGAEQLSEMFTPRLDGANHQ